MPYFNGKILAESHIDPEGYVLFEESSHPCKLTGGFDEEAYKTLLVQSGIAV
ncbi:MAG: hypothetical protein ABS876_05335 [Ruminococcus sp.]